MCFCNNLETSWPKNYLFSNFCIQNRVIGINLSINISKLLKGAKIYQLGYFLLNLHIELKPSLAPQVPRCLSFCEPVVTTLRFRLDSIRYLIICVLSWSFIVNDSQLANDLLVCGGSKAECRGKLKLELKSSGIIPH